MGAEVVEKASPGQSSAEPPAVSPLSEDQLDALYVLGYSFIQHRQNDKAMTLFEALAALYPDDPHVQKSLSYVYLCARRYGDALVQAEAWQAQADASAEPLSATDVAGMALLQSRALWGLDRAGDAREQLRRFIAAQEKQA